MLVENNNKKEINIALQTEGLKKTNAEKLRQEYNVDGWREMNICLQINGPQI